MENICKLQTNISKTIPIYHNPTEKLMQTFVKKYYQKALKNIERSVRAYICVQWKYAEIYMQAMALCNCFKTLRKLVDYFSITFANTTNSKTKTHALPECLLRGAWNDEVKREAFYLSPLKKPGSLYGTLPHSKLRFQVMPLKDKQAGQQITLANRRRKNSIPVYPPTSKQ